MHELGFPALKIVNKSGKKIGNEVREQIHKFLESNLAKEHAVTETSIPKENVLWSDLLQPLEEAALSDQEMPPTVANFIDAAQVYFKRIAIEEHLISPSDALPFRIKLIPKDVWDTYDQTRGNSGFLETESNTIYIAHRVPLTPQNMLQMCITLFHEMRHRVSRRTLTAQINSQENQRISLTKMLDLALDNFRGPNNEVSFLEEVFVHSYTTDHVGDVINALNDPELNGAWQERQGYFSTNTNQPIPAGLFMPDDQGEFDPHRAMTADLFYKIRNILMEHIPDIMDLLKAVRSGEKHSKLKLARKIKNVFGKKVLATMVYATAEDRPYVESILKSVTEIKSAGQDPDNPDPSQHSNFTKEFWIARILGKTAGWNAVKSFVHPEAIREIEQEYPYLLPKTR